MVRLVQRSRIVLAYADDPSVARVSHRLGVSAPTVAKRRDRFLVDRLDGLEDAPRPGRPGRCPTSRSRRLSAGPWRGCPRAGTRTGRPGRWPPTRGSTRPRCRVSGGRLGSSRTPWTPGGCPRTPELVDKVRDIVGSCMSPPEGVLVLAVDEKSRIQSPGRIAPILPMMPATLGTGYPRLRPSRHDHALGGRRGTPLDCLP